MTNRLTWICTALATSLALGCGGDDSSIDDSASAGESISLEASKDDRVGNRYIDRFGGTLAYGADAKVADIPVRYYTVGYTLRASAGHELKVSAVGHDSASLDTVLRLYGPQTRGGGFPFVAENDDQSRGNRSSVIKYTPRTQGIYLVIATAKSRGKVDVNLGCRGEGNLCDLGCAVIRLYRPVCGADGTTYSNPQAAACYAVPVAHEGRCGAALGETCTDDGVDAPVCGEGLFCSRPVGICGRVGTCATRPEACIQLYQPVCGCDGHTYGNGCTAASAGMNIVHTGECAPACTGDTDYAPAPADIVGGFSNPERNTDVSPAIYPRTFGFAADGTVTIQDAVAPCPAGATCFWSGIVSVSARWSINGTKIQLDGLPQTPSFDIGYYKELLVKRTCDGGTNLFEVRNDGSNIVRVYKRAQ